MTAADALYLPVSEGFYSNASLPGKLFEYLGSGSPVLAAVPAQSDAARVLAEVGLVKRVEPDDDVEIAATLRMLCRGDVTGLFSERQEENLWRYTRAATAEQLARTFEAVSVGQACRGMR